MVEVLVVGLLCILVISVLGALFGAIIVGLVGSLTWIWILFFALSNIGIDTDELQTWSWRTFNNNWRKKGLIHTISIYFAACLIFSLFFATLSAFSFAFVYDFFHGFVYGFVYSLVFSFAMVFRNFGTKTTYLLHITNPYQRFLSDFRNSFWPIPFILLSVVTGILVAAITLKGSLYEDLIIWVQNSSFWLKILLGSLALLLISLLIASFPKHFAFRLVLYLEGKMPLRVVTFLDRMTDQHIFEDNRRTDKKGKKRRGATWRFRHKILQDYFAGKPL